MTGFVSPQIGEALADPSLDRLFGAFGIVHAKAGTVVVAPIELSQVAVQMGFADVVINAVDAALKDAEKVSAVLMCMKLPRRTYSFAEWFTVPWLANSLPTTGYTRLSSDMSAEARSAFCTMIGRTVSDVMFAT